MSLGRSLHQSILVRVMVWCHQAPSHYLSQCWPRFMPSYDVTRPQGVKISSKPSLLSHTTNTLPASPLSSNAVFHIHTFPLVASLSHFIRQFHAQPVGSGGISRAKHEYQQTILGAEDAGTTLLAVVTEDGFVFLHLSWNTGVGATAHVDAAV